MTAGLFITHTHAPDHPGFWYPCGRKEVKAVLSSHLSYWGREQVSVDGLDVARQIPLECVVATYCQGLLTDQDGRSKPDRPETLDVWATLGVAKPNLERVERTPADES